MQHKFNLIILTGAVVLSLSGCGAAVDMVTQKATDQMAAPADPLAEVSTDMITYQPTVLEDNTGKYMSPYTSDEVLAEWVDKSINAKMGSALGSTAGAYAGAKVVEDIPFVGSLVGEKVGNEVGRKLALEAAGGEVFIKQTSDISFNDLKDMAIFLFINYKDNKHYADAVDATKAIYPELATSYDQYILSAMNAE